MNYFIPLFIVAIVFYLLGRYDKDGHLKIQRKCIIDGYHRESALYNQVKELQAEIVTLNSMRKGA